MSLVLPSGQYATASFFAAMPGNYPALFEMEQTENKAITYNEKKTITYKCRLCYKYFEESELSDHVRKIEHLIPSEGELFATCINHRLCVFCGHVYPANQIQRHHSSHHGAQRTVPWFFRGFLIDLNHNFVCSTCNYQFPDLLAMTRHMFQSPGSVD